MCCDSYLCLLCLLSWTLILKFCVSIVCSPHVSLLLCSLVWCHGHSFDQLLLLVSFHSNSLVYWFCSAFIALIVTSLFVVSRCMYIPWIILCFLLFRVPWFTPATLCSLTLWTVLINLTACGSTSQPVHLPA